MNFLSTGEKIKRARIYKGITLKELCQKDISISKMSCIENDKIKADEWILQMVATRLNLDIKYLLYDDSMELENSIKVYEDKEVLIDIDFIDIKERIDYCLAKEYKSIALSFIHILFSEYTKRRKFADIKNLMNLYSEFNNLNEEQEQLYYEDLAKYFLVRRNYSDAITYFNRTRNHIFNYTISSKMNCYIENSILLSISYYLNHQYNESEELLEELLYLEDKIKSEEQIILVNGLLAVIKKHLNKEYLSYKKLFDSYDNKSGLKYSKINIMMSKLYIIDGEKDKAISIIKSTTDSVNRNDIYSYIELIISIIKILLEAKEIGTAKSYCEEVLDLSIKLDNYFLIEKSYLYKARLDRVERNLLPWEMNMNLATDVLIKFATVQEKRERYIEMAEMYHVIGEIRESLKYLTLAMNLEKNNDI